LKKAFTDASPRCNSASEVETTSLPGQPRLFSLQNWCRLHLWFHCEFAPQMSALGRSVTTEMNKVQHPNQRALRPNPNAEITTCFSRPFLLSPISLWQQQT
jgi:hypothetical protein